MYIYIYIHIYIYIYNTEWPDSWTMSIAMPTISIAASSVARALIRSCFADSLSLSACGFPVAEDASKEVGDREGVGGVRAFGAAGCMYGRM